MSFERKILLPYLSKTTNINRLCNFVSLQIFRNIITRSRLILLFLSELHSLLKTEWKRFMQLFDWTYRFLGKSILPKLLKSQKIGGKNWNSFQKMLCWGKCRLICFKKLTTQLWSFCKMLMVNRAWIEETNALMTFKRDHSLQATKKVNI